MPLDTHSWTSPASPPGGPGSAGARGEGSISQSSRSPAQSCVLRLASTKAGVSGTKVVPRLACVCSPTPVTGKGAAVRRRVSGLPRPGRWETQLSVDRGLLAPGKGRAHRDRWGSHPGPDRVTNPQASPPNGQGKGGNGSGLGGLWRRGHLRNTLCFPRGRKVTAELLEEADSSPQLQGLAPQPPEQPAARPEPQPKPDEARAA